MKKSAFLSISYSTKDILSSEIDTVVNSLTESGFRTLVFVKEFSYSSTQEKEMMEKALEEIEKCNIFIAEVSTKAIGVGIEIGYAKALGKPIIYLRNSKSEQSKTVAGIADYIISYKNLDVLRDLLLKTVKNIKL
ncbi:MAG: nucleoside 2-deoxyribosyltransferase [Candidatus Levybacteria bacterium]|nr:nucleoside 2-deoxyribosyltransferase [Candidatus Levybacteria bacterium]